MSLDDYLEKYAAKGILIDTNVLVLLVVGLYREERIKTFKRTKQYTPGDFRLILRFVDRFQRRITTPNILTETDNIVRQLAQREHEHVARVLAILAAEFCEQYQPSRDITQTLWFVRLGLADCVTIAIAQDVLVITDDWELSGILSNLDRDAININHVRELN